MKNKISVLLIGMLFITTFLPIIKADGPIKQYREQDDYTSYTYLNENELLITYTLPGLTQTPVITEKGEFTKLEIQDSGFIGDIGSPQIPAQIQVFAVPTHQISFEIQQTHVKETWYIERLYPVQNPQSDSDTSEQPFMYDEAAYQQDIMVPGHIAEIIYSGDIRDIPFENIRFCPIQYNPSQHTAVIYDSITIKLTFTTAEPVVVEPRFRQGHFNNFYTTVFNNWPGFIDNTQFQDRLGGKETGCNYLIITHQNFYAQATQLADWKHATGLMAKTVNMSEIGTTAAQIRQYLINAYETWTPRPSYVLLLGDAEYVPPSFADGVATDLLYTTLDGTDYYPDLFIGRMPADSATQAEVMVQKTITYEQTPPALQSFYDNFVVAAYFQDDDSNHYEDRRFVLTSEEIRDYLLSLGYNGQRIYCTSSSVNPTHYNNDEYANGEPLPAELLRPTFPWNGNANDISAAIQQGIFLLNHRDHGMEEGWGDPYFTTDDFMDFSNGELLPVVFSINCLTGKFNNNECFCEEFLRKDDGGAVAVFGASEISYSGYNDWLCRGFYDGMWPAFDPLVGGDVALCTLGEILNYGKAYMADTWGDPWDYEEYTFELFHCFGDPALDMFTALPSPLEVTYAPLSDIIQVTVNANDLPLQGARVCISQEGGFYQAGLTDENGIIFLDKTDASIEEPVSLVVTAHNCLYYHESFMLNQKPQQPGRPTGPAEGKPNTQYMYKASTVDVDGDRLYYNFSWGDGTYSGWVGPFDSGTEASTRHAWAQEGSFTITVKAKDTKGEESIWSEPLVVDMPLGIPFTHPFLQWLYEIINDRFPLLASLLQLML